MKKTSILILIFGSIILSNCYSSKPKVKGSGDVVKEKREASDFTHLKINGIIDVVLVPGNAVSVEVETDKELQKFIHVYNSGGALIINTDDDYDIKFTKNIVRISYKEIEQIEHNGVGSVKTNGTLYGNKLNVYNNGVGNTSLEVSCDELKVSQCGVGSVDLIGNAQILRVENSGVGSINAFDLKSQKVKAVNSGVGSIDVYANSELDVSSSGIGSVKYKGNGQLMSKHTSGLGSIKKVD